MLSTTSSASLSKLSNEYVNAGSDNESTRMDLEINEVSRDLVNESRPWTLSADSSYKSSTLESSATLLPSDSKSNDYEIGIAKDFFTGTNLSFTNTLSDYTNNISTTSNNTGFTQSLSISQDLWKNFLGRNDKLDLTIAEETYNFQKQNTSAVIETNLFTFVSNYLEVKVNLALVELQKLTVDRAKKRLNLIQRRVRDGLSEKVDLFSAQTRNLGAKENLRSNKINLEASLEELSKKLHRHVGANEVEAYKIQIQSELSKVEGQIEDNQNLQASLKQISYLQSTLDQKENTLYPSLKLAGSYTTNNYESNGSPIANGVLGSENNQLAVGLNLTWNIGSIPEKLNKEASSISLNKAKMVNRKRLLSLKQQETFLKRRVVEVEALLVTALKRLKIAEKTLKEYNRLYTRGRANLDQVIRAEEDLIVTQESYVRYLLRRDSYYASQAYLYGNLKKAIFK